ncbi:hypothetical protein Hanom_Chr15g01389531 [Helianthus anomalus]
MSQILVVGSLMSQINRICIFTVFMEGILIPLCLHFDPLRFLNQILRNINVLKHSLPFSVVFVKC